MFVFVHCEFQSVRSIALSSLAPINANLEAGSWPLLAAAAAAALEVAAATTAAAACAATVADTALAAAAAAAAMVAAATALWAPCCRLMPVRAGASAPAPFTDCALR